MRIVFIQSLMIPKQKTEAIFRAALPGHEFIYYEETSSEDDLLLRVREADILVTSNYPISKRVIESAHNLKMISVSFAGFDNIDLDAAKTNNITVTNTPGYCIESVSELAVCLAICLLRKVMQANNNVLEGKWRQGLNGFELNSKTIGVIGLGHIGLETAKKFALFGCKVLGYNRSPKYIQGVEQVSLNRLLSESDIITLHLALSNDTRGFIGEAQFALMKRGVSIINLARGPIIENTALIKALHSGILNGVAIDVYDREPAQANELPLDTGNILLTPHIGFFTEEALERRAIMAIKNIAAFISGNPTNSV
jgi:phosphoglycerate dehydrogenase-like enzyme